MMMSEPVIADTKPAVLDLEPGNYWWCSCGQSENPPYCDGAHKGSDFTPVKLTVAESSRVSVCQCKHSQNPPFCDGSHRNLS